MRMNSISLAAALMLGSMAGAYAQSGPSEEREMPAPSQSREEPQGEPSAKRDQKGAQQAEPKGQSQTKKDSQASEKSNEPGKAREGMKEGAAPSKESDTSKQAQPSKQGEPSKQAEPKADTSNQAAEPKATEPSKQTQIDNTDTTKQPGAADRKSADQTKQPDAADSKSAEQAKQVQLPAEKAEKVRTALSSVNVKQESNINVNISIGSRLPSSLHFHPIPVEVVTLVPEYRNFVFIMVEGRYVIVEPRTYEIVTIIDAPQRVAAGGGGGGGGERACGSGLTLSDEERDFILKSVQITGDVDARGVTIGWRVPESVQLMPFPEPVLERAAKLKSCRYFVVENQIAIVDPDEDKVVMLLEDED